MKKLFAFLMIFSSAVFADTINVDIVSLPTNWDNGDPVVEGDIRSHEFTYSCGGDAQTVITDSLPIPLSVTSAECVISGRIIDRNGNRSAEAPELIVAAHSVQRLPSPEYSAERVAETTYDQVIALCEEDPNCTVHVTVSVQ